MKKRAEKPKNGRGMLQQQPAFLDCLTRRLAERLECIFSKYSKTKAVIILAVFCTGTITLLCWIAAQGFYTEGRTNLMLERLSKEASKPKEEHLVIPSDDNILKRLSRGRSYLDSLRQDPALKYKYDSLMRARPGLLDSLRQAEDYFKH